MGRVVLHVDADAFFVQVEQLRHPELQGKPVAVQQHQDIIAANHAAKKAGVRKHMLPCEARAVLAGVGGHVVHVFLEDGFRASYRPYREMCAALIRLYKGFSSAPVVEKASIDEAFILVAGSNNGGHSISNTRSDVGHDVLLTRGQQLAHDIRAAAKQELGITLSVGVAPNKLLAKLASKQAKPDGVKVIPAGSAELADMLANTSIGQLPGMGGRVSASLSHTGVTTCSGLAALLNHHPLALQQLGLPAPKAALLAAYCKGEDGAAVVDKGPPKSIQVQMTLTPIPWPVPTSVLKPGSGMPVGQPSLGSLANSPNSSLTVQAAAAAAGHAAPPGGLTDAVALHGLEHSQQSAAQPVDSNDRVDDSIPSGEHMGRRGLGSGSTSAAGQGQPQQPTALVLQPLPVKGPDTRQRITSVLRCMCRDLVGRVVLDRHQEGRWPGKLGLSLHCQHPDHRGAYNTAGTSNLVSRSTAFPSAALLDAPAPAPTTSPPPPPYAQQPKAQALAQVDHAHARTSSSGHSLHAGHVSNPVVSAPVANLMVSERLFVPDGVDVGERKDVQGQSAAGAVPVAHPSARRQGPAASTFEGGGGVTGREEGWDTDYKDSARLQGSHAAEAVAANQPQSPLNGVQAVLDAVLKSELSLAMAVLQQQPHGWVVSLVAVSASNMQSIDKNSAPTITRFLKPAGHAASEPHDEVPTTAGNAPTKLSGTSNMLTSVEAAAVALPVAVGAATLGSTLERNNDAAYLNRAASAAEAGRSYLPDTRQLAAKDLPAANCRDQHAAARPHGSVVVANKQSAKRQKTSTTIQHVQGSMGQPLVQHHVAQPQDFTALPVTATAVGQPVLVSASGKIKLTQVFASLATLP